ncbi:nucleotide exchange factor GrpE [Streptomyces iconiensis]|uniref:Nucleotide exchange factor GrpE n=1 Tax=Streptomyces iconiensis TaxID=1384038 RepID=A0ABT7A7Y4_9ACTN|nr:nucleotide exchange factor GrpE [Streptomyces iconiensis]MDJ1137448.1 nucleotide exchange factor GrpE [Streptomyces iconiensis]
MNGPTPRGGSTEDRLAFEFATALGERDAAHQAETERLLLAVADALDSFGRLLDGGPEAAAQDPAGFAAGVRLATGQLEKAVRERGLEPIGVHGELAEPATHLVTEVRDEPGPEDSVVEVLQRGYRHQGRVLRAARVAVASGTAQGPEPAPLSEPEPERTPGTAAAPAPAPTVPVPTPTPADPAENTPQPQEPA